MLPASVPVITLCLFERVREGGKGGGSMPALMNKALIAGIQFPALIVSVHVTGIAVVHSSHPLFSEEQRLGERSPVVLFKEPLLSTGQLKQLQRE